MNNILITIKKELRSLIRDKKTMLILLLMPVLSGLFVFFYGFFMDNSAGVYDSSFEIGIDFDLDTTETAVMAELYLSPNKYENVGEMKKAYENGDIAAYIDYDLSEDKYYAYSDGSEDGLKLESLFMSYFQTCGLQNGINYLISEDIDYEKVFNSYNYESVNIEGKDFLLTIVYSSVFMMIVLGMITPASNMATSATATEKENGTLETILSFPVSTKQLILGKFLAILIGCVVTVIIEYFLTILSLFLSNILFETFSDFNVSFSIGTILLGLISCFVASLFITSSSLLLTANAKSYKESQSSLAILSYFSMIPMFANMLFTDISVWYYFIPIANATQILIDLFSNNFNLINFIITICSLLIYSVVLYLLIIKQYKSERVLFGD